MNMNLQGKLLSLPEALEELEVLHPNYWPSVVRKSSLII